MSEVYILSGIRTPIGAFQGSLNAFTAPQLGSFAIREAIKKASIDKEDIEEVYMGCVLTGGLGQAPARQASLAAGLSTKIPCTTINKVCGSGMKSIMIAAQAIKAGDNHLMVAGGMESMSNVPYALAKARQGYRLGNDQLIDLMINDGLWDPYKNVHMGNCGEMTAKTFDFDRDEMDQFAKESFLRARKAQEKQYFSDEIFAIEVPQNKSDSIWIKEDEGPRKRDLNKLSSLKPAFDKNGSITAGNASSINDAGAAIIIASEQYVKKNNLKPLGRIVSYSSYAHEPELFTTAPAFAIEKLLKKNNLSIQDIDLFEINEAFAVVAMFVAQKLRINHSTMNVNGGAIALGHPIGMTGTRLVITALHELRRRKGKMAIASPCIGGGEATAILIEALYS